MAHKNKLKAKTKVKAAIGSPCNASMGPDIQNVASFKDDTTDDTGPTVSPYMERSCYLLVGPNEVRYTVPYHYLQKSPYLLSQLDAPKPSRHHWPELERDARDIRVPDLDEDIAHTLVHFLYTNEYQTLRRQAIPNSEGEAVEYRRSVLVYQTAGLYGLPSLAAQAKKKIRRFGRSVSVFDALGVAREVYENLPKDGGWFYNHLREKIQGAFNVDEGMFARNQFLDYVRDPFSGALIKIVVDTFDNKLSIAGVKGDRAGRYDHEELTFCDGAANEEVAAEEHNGALVADEDCPEEACKAISDEVYPAEPTKESEFDRAWLVRRRNKGGN